MTTEEKNVVFAKFMGESLIHCTNDVCGCTIEEQKNEGCGYLEYCPQYAPLYHLDWNELMKVVARCYTDWRFNGNDGGNEIAYVMNTQLKHHLQNNNRKSAYDYLFRYVQFRNKKRES